MNARLSTLVAGGLLAFGLLALIGIVVLSGLDKPVPGILENLAAGALGAFSALLARVGSETQDVQVVNGPARPVPVDGDSGHLELAAALCLLGLAIIAAVLALRIGLQW